MNTENLKVGDLLEAIDFCQMSESKEHALIIGKHYVIREIDENEITIKSEVHREHTFQLFGWQEFFKKVDKAKPTQDPKAMTIKEKTKLLKALAKVVKATEKDYGHGVESTTSNQARIKIQEILKTINVD